MSIKPNAGVSNLKPSFGIGQEKITANVNELIPSGSSEEFKITATTDGNSVIYIRWDTSLLWDSGIFWDTQSGEGKPSAIVLNR
jgi:hypothetical protein